MPRNKNNKNKNNNNNHNNNNKPHKEEIVTKTKVQSQPDPSSPTNTDPISDPASPTDSDQSRPISPTSPDMDTHHPHLIHPTEHKEKSISPRVRATSPHKKYSDVDVIQPIQQQQHAREEKEKSKIKGSPQKEQREGEGETITTSRPKLATPAPTHQHETAHEQAIPQPLQTQTHQPPQQEQQHINHPHIEKKIHEPNMDEKLHVAEKPSALEQMGTIRRVMVSLLVIGFSASTASTDLGLSLLSSVFHRVLTYIFHVICGENNVFWNQFQNQQDITRSHAMEPGFTPSWFSWQYLVFRVGLVIKHIDRLIYEMITTSRVVAATSLIPTIFLRLLSFLCPEDAHDLLYKHQLEQMHENQHFRWQSIIILLRLMTPFPTMELPCPKPITGLI